MPDLRRKEGIFNELTSRSSPGYRRSMAPNAERQRLAGQCSLGIKQTILVEVSERPRSRVGSAGGSLNVGGAGMPLLPGDEGICDE